MPTLGTRRELEAAMDEWLDAQESPVMRLFYQLQIQQADALTLNDLRKALASGSLPAALTRKWGDQWDDWVGTAMVPRWTAASRLQFRVLAAQMRDKLGVNPSWTDTKELFATWRIGHREAMVRGLVFQQLEGVVGYITQNDHLDPHELRKRLLPIIGLDARSMGAVDTKRMALQVLGLSPAEVDRQTAEYADYLRRVRAARVARTELVRGFNEAHTATIKAAQDKGLIRGATKTWLTSRDERVCRVCRPLDEQTRKLDSTFTSRGLTVSGPPIHPSCRCTLVYAVESQLKGFEVEQSDLVEVT